MKTKKGPDHFFTVPGISLKNKKMLLIEDDPTCTLLIKELFSDSGMWILSAMNGRNGLWHLTQNPDTDIILLDIRLPDIDGFRVYENIHKIKPSLPVIAITAGASSDIAYRCRKSGFYGFMFKPFDIAGLFRMVNFALELKPIKQ
jgi:two-component system response regulator AtoC